MTVSDRFFAFEWPFLSTSSTICFWHRTGIEFWFQKADIGKPKRGSTDRPHWPNLIRPSENDIRPELEGDIGFSIEHVRCTNKTGRSFNYHSLSPRTRGKPANRWIPDGEKYTVMGCSGVDSTQLRCGKAAVQYDSRTYGR